MPFLSKHTTIALAIMIALFYGAAVFAQPLEIQYPQLPGAELSQKPLLPDFIKYLYTFSVLAAGFLAVGSSVYGGFKYIASAGSPSARNEARAQITGGILGSLVILGGYILLSTVNPQLTIFKLEKPLAQIQIPSKTVTTCDCLNPITELTEQCKEKCAASNFLEIPVGTLIDKVLDQNRLNKFESIAKQIEEKSKIVKEKAGAFKQELDQCSCQKETIIPGCTENCTPLQCTGEPCDRTAIAKKKVELNVALDELAKYIEENIGVNITAEEP